MPHSPVIVTFALPQESGDFRRALRRRSDWEVGVEYIGVGPAVAKDRIGGLLAKQVPGLTLCICTGFAGGLDPQVRTADLVIAENLSSPDLLSKARECLPPSVRCHFGSVASCTEPVESVESKSALFRETGALAIDMESETVAQACRAAGVPLLVVRTISDPADVPLPVPFPHWFDITRQQPRTVGLLKYLASHPDRILPFAGFVRGLAPARRSLADFLIHFLERRKE
jgi:adenosylhomocysteine nucleosidase